MELNNLEWYESIFEIFDDIYFGRIDLNDIVEFTDYIKNYDDIKFFNDYLIIINSLHKYQISSKDFLNLSNIGYKRNTKDLVYFDIGFGEYVDDNFDEGLKFCVEKESEIFEILNFENKGLLGGNGNGEAFEINDNKVLKITIDDSEAYNSSKLELKEINGLNYIHSVYGLSIMGIENKWVIIQDKVDDNKLEITERYLKLNQKFIEFKTNLI